MRSTIRTFTSALLCFVASAVLAQEDPCPISDIEGEATYTAPGFPVGACTLEIAGWDDPWVNGDGVLKRAWIGSQRCEDPNAEYPRPDHPPTVHMIAGTYYENADGQCQIDARLRTDEPWIEGDIPVGEGYGEPAEQINGYGLVQDALGVEAACELGFDAHVSMFPGDQRLPSYIETPVGHIGTTPHYRTHPYSETSSMLADYQCVYNVIRNGFSTVSRTPSTHIVGGLEYRVASFLSKTMCVAKEDIPAGQSGDPFWPSGRSKGDYIPSIYCQTEPGMGWQPIFGGWDVNVTAVQQAEGDYYDNDVIVTDRRGQARTDEQAAGAASIVPMNIYEE